ncbi:excinuclease ABC, A subunit [Bernardetia litoralis DSM 6794]|uniref:UvrABC system protein A n=1 Tax=Bernardetia litoralis (strain ATCC 23117 / DSM 6794 / NBRC 15988 / NCIMB 1366 / Fx l1 / Sio-4) TaxID=880071 RepID=I4APZ6_BERLS|nr:excinuclease ABC subunit UvrA [Bernardetia litoralis]AFM06031.1 excinuclease ABC, A subunit [Bernardetia litoralis DSM 6794]
MASATPKKNTTQIKDKKKIKKQTQNGVDSIHSSENHPNTTDFIEVFGAREHNLKNIDISFPRQQLIVITGISGSGKSSLAFDTIYAEGQRRYMESFSAYARSFLGNLERPDVDKINGLSPVISIEQKTTSKNPRSTVGTTTEIYDFMRLLYARAGIAYSYNTGERMIRQTEEQISEIIFEEYKDKKLVLLAPVVKGRKGHYRELFVQLRKSGYTKVRIDGEIMELVPKMQTDRYKTHDIEVVVDRIIVSKEDEKRIMASLKTAMKVGNGIVMIQEHEQKEARFFSRFLMCPTTGIAYDEPAPNIFSFNSPYGMCQTCNGLGKIEQLTEESIIPDDTISISRGAIAPLGEYRDTYFFKKLAAFMKSQKVNITTVWKEIDKKIQQKILYGSKEIVKVKAKSSDRTWNSEFEGVIDYLEKYQLEGNSKQKTGVQDYLTVTICPACEGARLKKESLQFKIADKNISELAQKDINQLGEFFEDIESRLEARQNIIAAEILKEIRKRIGFLLDVGLDYLTLDRPVRTLSGGEAQRIRLATQIGTQLVGVLYILDEPSIGLHSRDNVKLIKALQDLRDLGNTVIVVEHDKDMMLAADYLVDIGPGAGRHGGKVVEAGTPAEFLKGNSTTAQYLNNQKRIEVPTERRKGNDKELVLKGANGNNLRNVTAHFPLGKLICVTGVSGSGKSTLIHDTLYPILNKHIYRSVKTPLDYKEIEGLKNIDKVIEVDQSPIGRTPRSNPATYTGVFTDIRALFTQLPEAKVRGYKPGRFSFNVKGGRCEECEGAGRKLIEMDFLPDVHVECPMCKGKRYNRETLEIRFKGKSISDVLDMSVEEASEFFANQPNILRRIKTLNDVGLGYITLGQHATTLSGGEAQRVKLSSELSKKDTGKTFYILDEPTTGLHFKDVQFLLDVLDKLVGKGNTVLVIEHNLDVIKVSDWIIDLGLEGGAAGGQILVEGTPEKVAKNKKSYTAKFLREELK